ncbi:hypothetical protein GGX14DRAFT_581356 [Mycena pura]|uniref:Uncharacterized protein n=1 Tax=Mycena pura TaxID=153505 RepID=A0AAD7E603_9AGAR|nr:hypothetical protein GGX14DRAFT_581356 [Mycena pura]
MEMLAVSIDASLHAEAAAVPVDDVHALETRVPEVDEPGVYELPAHVSWVADMLVHLQGTPERGELPDNEYELKLEELQADELDEQSLLAEGWVWNDERGDYWHPERGWGADRDEEDSGIAPSLLSDTSHFSEDATSPYLADVSEATDTVLNLDLSSQCRQHVYLVTAPILTLPPSFTSPVRPAPRKHGPTRYFIPRLASSARPATKNQHRAGRRTRSCPDFKRDSPPHFTTPPALLTQLKVADATVPSSPPIPPDISESMSSTVVVPDTGPVRTAGPPEPPIAVVNVDRAPVPPDIHRPCPGSDLAAQRRRNAMRRILKKSKSMT